MRKKNLSFVAKKIPVEILPSIYLGMLKIRETEERLADLALTGEIKCPIHLYIGQEAVAVGVCQALRTTDYVFGTHRSHGHYLAKGGDLKKLIAEVFGKETGCSKGRGGSMHLAAPEVGFMGSSAMVAAGIPVAVGSAIAFMMQEKQSVAIAFFGDGATEEGIFHESLNLAALKKAPVIFICENNQYSSHLHIRDRRSTDNILEIVRANHIPTFQINGNNVIEVYQTAKAAVEQARAGDGPVFIECKTYRWRGHVGPHDDLDKGLRNQDELDRWRAQCPIESFEKHLKEEGILTDAGVIRLRQEVTEEIQEAIAFARRSFAPDPSELTRYVFSSEEKDSLC